MRDRTAALPTLAAVETLSFGTSGIQYKERLTCHACVLFGGSQQGRAEPLAPSAAMDQHLDEISAVGLVLWLLQHQTNRANDCGMIPGHKEEAFATLHLCGNILPVGVGLGTGHGPHEAN
jgi:hypothetical protein